MTASRTALRACSAPRRAGGFVAAALTVAVLAGPASAQTAEPAPAYTGSYVMEGRNPDGTPYGGTVDIVQSGTLAILTWRIGNDVFVGTGVASSRSIAVAYGPVVVLFEKGTAGELTGVWTAQGHNKLGYEILRRK